MEGGQGDEGKIHFARGYPIALEEGRLLLSLFQAQVSLAQNDPPLTLVHLNAKQQKEKAWRDLILQFRLHVLNS